MRHGARLALLVQRMFKYIITLLAIAPTIVGANSCVVLLYHNISDTTPRSTSISPELFEQHLKYLHDNDFNVVTLEQMIEDLRSNNIPNRCVSLTADDANISIYKNAFPSLKKYKMPMSVFVSTDSIDNSYPSMMGWQQMREMQTENIYFYNHSVTHPYLVNMSEIEINHQITQAQRRLEQELGVYEKFFAYPYGEESVDIIEHLEGLGYVSFGQQSGALSYNNDLSNLPRFPMSASFADMESFKTKINTIAMPVIHNRVDSVVYNSAPVLELEFTKPLSALEQKQFNCYAGGGVAKVDWKSNTIVTIQNDNTTTSRRFRYNCTMPSNNSNSYYWYSKQFIKGDNI